MQTLFSDIAVTAGKQFKQHKTTARHHRPQDGSRNGTDKKDRSP